MVYFWIKNVSFLNCGTVAKFSKKFIISESDQKKKRELSLLYRYFALIIFEKNSRFIFDTKISKMLTLLYVPKLAFVLL